MPKKRLHPNKVCGYLKPKNEALFKGYIAVNELGVSEGINIILKDFFSRLPENEKVKYLNKKNKS
jgi:hypothetical protein